MSYEMWYEVEGFDIGIAKDMEWCGEHNEGAICYISHDGQEIGLSFEDVINLQEILPMVIKDIKKYNEDDKIEKRQKIYNAMAELQRELDSLG